MQREKKRQIEQEYVDSSYFKKNIFEHSRTCIIIIFGRVYRRRKQQALQIKQ